MARGPHRVGEPDDKDAAQQQLLRHIARQRGVKQHDGYDGVAALL